MALYDTAGSGVCVSVDAVLCSQYRRGCKTSVLTIVVAFMHNVRVQS